MDAVHPHVRGAVPCVFSISVKGIGSSPRAWGGSGRIQMRRLETRFIPTCVGRLVSMFLHNLQEAVHPHVRGAVMTKGEFIGVAYGSSPRAWGGFGWDERCVSDTGSSPRAWGGCVERLRLGGGDRFIPTCVGRLAARSATRLRRPVHPHVRGAVRRRFIPTCVGRLLGFCPKLYRSVKLSRCGDKRLPVRKLLDECEALKVGGESAPVSKRPHGEPLLVAGGE